MSIGLKFGLIFLAVTTATSAAFADGVVRTVIVKNDMANYPGALNASMACLGSTTGSMTDSKTAIAPGETYVIPGNPSTKVEAQFSISLNSGDLCTRWGGAGSFGFGVNPDGKGNSWGYSYTGIPVTGVSISSGTDCNGPADAVCYDLNYTAPNPLPSLILNPTQPTQWVKHISSYDSPQYRGVSLSGAEFSPNTTGSGLYYSGNMPSVNDDLSFAQAGMNTVRLPFLWEYLQPSFTPGTPMGPVNFAPTSYGYQLMQVLSDLTGQGLYVVLDMHDYMRYETNLQNIPNASDSSDLNIIGTSGEPTGQDYENTWADLATAVNTYLPITQRPYVIFEPMNEPHDITVPQVANGDKGPQAVLDLENQAIAGIRASEDQNGGSHHLILLDGDYYSGLHNWTTANFDGATNASVFTAANIKDADKNYALDVHQYMDSNFSGTHATCIPENNTGGTDPGFDTDLDLKDFSAYLNQENINAFLGEFGAGNGDITDCENDFNDLLTQVKNYAATDGHPGFIGWTAWSAGHAWGASYLLNLAPGGAANIWMSDSQVFKDPNFLNPEA